MVAAYNCLIENARIVDTLVARSASPFWCALAGTTEVVAPTMPLEEVHTGACYIVIVRVDR